MNFNPYRPPSPGPDEDYSDYEQIAEFFDENVRLYHTLRYALTRAAEDGRLKELELLGSKLEADEEAHLADLENILSEILLALRSKYGGLELFSQEFPNPAVARLMARFELQYLIDQIDENGDSTYPESAAFFLREASRDYFRAVERADATLMESEDLLMAHIFAASE